MSTQTTSSLPPTVTVVVPVYNGAMTIANCLESLLDQTYPADRYEIVVVENGSTDETTEVVQRYPVRLFHNEVRGPAAARNRGICESTADIIAFTDADCIANPNWLVELIRPYADPTISGVGGDIQPYRHEKRTIFELFSEEYAPIVNYVSGEHEFYPHLSTPNASYRRELLVATNGFDERLLTGEDIEISWRLQVKACAKLAYAHEAIVYHHHRSTRQGLCRQYRQYGYGEVLLDTLFGYHPNYPRSRKFQLQRILGQVAALPRYMVSGVLRGMRLVRGRVNPYEAAVPWIWLLVESSNIRGKIEGLVATRLMTNPKAALNIQADAFIQRMFPDRKA